VADDRAALKPVMSVVYAPANDMLHAFRAGPCYSPSTTPADCNGASVSEDGGEELWGFVPFDQLNALLLRAIHEPQGRANHVFMITRGVRFADVFVPSDTPMTNKVIGGVTVPSMLGVWRRVIYFGRGIGGKYITALDVTAPGPYTAASLDTTGPIPLWSRGNPDTQDGLPGGPDNNALDGDDKAAYARMGETWSMPTVAYVNEKKDLDIYKTERRPGGIDFTIFVGSGYGGAGEGTTHYTLDALSGDVVAAVDVDDAADEWGLAARNLPYPNALVANSVSFNKSRFGLCSGETFDTETARFRGTHPWCNWSERVYVADLHGRLWKFLTQRPDRAIPAADLGADQPVGTAVALNIYKPDEDIGPYIFLSSGNDRRASGPFRNFTFADNGTSSDASFSGTSGTDGVTSYLPVALQFVRTYDQGDPEANCGYATEAVFRGTIQPTSTQEMIGDQARQVVFFGGTRLSLPNTKFAPPTPLACGTGQYPCRSQFDTILYGLGVESGGAAYDLNASGDDAYRIFRDSRIAAISMQADPNPGGGGSTFTADEGLMKGTPKPPPPPGVPPQGTTTSTGNVSFVRVPGQPAPAVRFGTTVCQ
jgi:hypothetical protein